MSRAGTEHQFWVETERQDTVSYRERSGEHPFGLEMSKPSVPPPPPDCVTVFEHEDKVSPGNTAGEEGAEEGVVRRIMAPAEFGTQRRLRPAYTSDSLAKGHHPARNTERSFIHPGPILRSCLQRAESHTQPSVSGDRFTNLHRHSGVNRTKSAHI